MDFLDRNTELRKLPVGVLNPIIDMLNYGDNWIKLMKCIPKDLTSDKFEPKYNAEHISIIKNYGDLNQNNYAKVLFDEWGTSGRVRPTLAVLKDLLVKVQLYRAADEIADMLREPRPERPSQGPAANINTNITFILNNTVSACQRPTAQMQTDRSLDSSGQFNKYIVPNLEALRPNSDVMVGDGSDSSSSIQYHSESSYTESNVQIDSAILEDTNLVQFSFEELQAITNNFSNAIGTGGFGDVFVGNHEQYGMLAIKRAHYQNKFSIDKDSNYNFIRVFNREVQSLSILRHENIVPILGFSLYGPSIVCEYVKGGSLVQKIAERVLNELERVKIMAGVAEGLKYIHNTVVGSTNNSEKLYFMHGDVKSANILLTEDYVPKLCDFGLSKQYANTLHSLSIKGTVGYMAPECLAGTVTQKSDIYSYGIVLLELLTGYKPIIKMINEKCNLKDYVFTKCPDDNITSVLDTTVPNWVTANDVYKLTKQCLTKEADLRPPMKVVCEKLREIECTLKV